MFDKYRDYFNINPEYFPQVNEAIINEKPDLWKTFYPHETFVKVIKDTVNVIARKQRVSLWVEGAYGTGKSHAVLTLKKLLDASEADTQEYFKKYPGQLSVDLLNQFQQVKSGEQKILTVHRYGSSSIRNDSNLVSAMQDSILRALADAGIESGAQASLKDAALKWLSEDWAKNAFQALVETEYKELFHGDNVDGIVEKLNTYTGESLQTLVGKIMQVGDEKQFKALTLDVDGLIEWIKAIIKENNLKSIIFIWDEFTEYFRNNMRALTGFQKIADLSASDPFYLLIVTHNVTHIFPETDQDWKKILGRFISPICNIELPENMAFRLMGAAMEKSKDAHVEAEWNETADELYERTHDSRDLVKAKASISDNELKNILPIHPYTALLLKHISSAFDSNQRSMFDFIKNDRGDEIKGFQWFIDNCGPMDENPLLTIDMLWDFFYEKGKEYLSQDVRAILDCFALSASKQLNRDEKRVLKTVLLLQAVSQRTGDAVELFLPNEKNVNFAFEGSDLENDAPARIADGMVPDVLFKKPMSGGKFQYSALINTGNAAELDKEKEKQREKSTAALVSDGAISEAVTFGGALRLRYVVEYVTAGDFKSKIRLLRNQEGTFKNKLVAVICFAKNELESALLGKYIKEAIAEGSFHMIFVDASVTPLGGDLLDQYVEAMANSVVNLRQDRILSAQYERNAKDVLKKWKARIMEGEFILFTEDKPEGERATTLDALYGELVAINRIQYPEGLETGKSVVDTMWQATSLASGVDCGVKQVTSGQFRSANEQTKLENYMGSEIWQKDEYWTTSPHLTISKVKKFVDDMISQEFATNRRISIAQIYEALQEAPYGFLPCNLTAFVMGFILKEYTNGSYTWNDGLTNDILSVEKLKEMVSEIIKHSTTPIPRYKNKYIVTMTEDERSFNEASAKIFGIPASHCTSVEQTRERIRQKMKELSFPIWSLKTIVGQEVQKTSTEAVVTLLDCYTSLANNATVAKSDSDIALEIGRLCTDHEHLVNDATALITKQNCTAGMDAYLHTYEGGTLTTLADEVGDNGQYINRLKRKFDADAANWVWNIDTAHLKIDEVILEYRIIVASNVIQPKSVSFDGVMTEWSARCGAIKVSYMYAKNSWGELSSLMALLYDIKRTGAIADHNRQQFLEQIEAKGEAFTRFYGDQIPLFKEVCAFLVDKFADEDVRELFRLLPNDMFGMEKSAYQTAVQAAVERFTSEQGTVKMKHLWKEKTGTDSPREWSEQYLTPILCMVPDKDIHEAKQVFEIIGRKRPDKAAIAKAMEFMEKANFFPLLGQAESRDEKFRTGIIRSYAVMLDDVDEVRTMLQEKISAKVYDWYAFPEVEKQMRQLAEFKYNQNGCDKALQKIADMDIDDVKRYLRDLIRDNMVVGMEIIKEN